MGAFREERSTMAVYSANGLSKERIDSVVP